MKFCCCCCCAGFVWREITIIKVQIEPEAQTTRYDILRWKWEKYAKMYVRKRTIILFDEQSRFSRGKIQFREFNLFIVVWCACIFKKIIIQVLLFLIIYIYICLIRVFLQYNIKLDPFIIKYAFYFYFLQCSSSENLSGNTNRIKKAQIVKSNINL